MRKLSTGLLAGAWLASQALIAEEELFRQHEAHVHGIGRLNVVLENDQLYLELLSPAANIIGFEHAPASEEQEKAMTQATQTLREAAQIFALPREADCQPVQAKVETTISDEEREEEHHANEVKAKGYEEGSENVDRESHEGHEAHEASEAQTHSEFHVTHAFRCAEPAKLRFIDVLLFQRFPGTEELAVQVIGPRGQTTRELTPDAARLEL